MATASSKACILHHLNLTKVLSTPYSPLLDHYVRVNAHEMAARGVVKYQDRPLPDWFKDRYKDCRWLVRNIDGVGYKFFINPEFPDSKDVVRSSEFLACAFSCFVAY